MNEIVITGIGVLSNCGIGFGKNMNHWLLSDKFTARYNIPNFNPALFMPEKYIERTDRSNQLAIAAVREAVHLSQLSFDKPDRIGLITVNALCGVHFATSQAEVLTTNGPSKISKYLSIGFFPCGTLGMLSILFGITGYSQTLAVSENSKLDALELGLDILNDDKVDYVIAGATEAPLVPTLVHAYKTKITPEYHPELSEASVFFILEKRITAEKRHAPFILPITYELLQEDMDGYEKLAKKIHGDSISVSSYLAFLIKLIRSRILIENKMDNGQSQYLNFHFNENEIQKRKENPIEIKS